jgi:hypothetical protein
MARSAVTVQSLSAYNTKGTVTKDAFDASNDHSIDVENVKTSNLAVFVEWTNTAAMSVVFKGGDFSDNGIGDLTLTGGSAKTEVVVLESARFKDEDELILIDLTGTGTGNIYAVELP